MRVWKLVAILPLIQCCALSQTGIDPKVLEKANAGDSFAQVYVALSYDLGKGVEQDHALAAQWFKKAADQGDTSAAVYLGADYEDGKGVPQDYAQAASWYLKAAEREDPWGERNLALLYLSGNGVAKDPTVAAKWLRKASEQGFSDAQYRLGGLHCLGVGVPQDYTEAYFWLDLALAGKLSPEAHESAISMKALAQHHLSDEKVGKIQERATIWFSQHPPSEYGKLPPSSSPPP